MAKGIATRRFMFYIGRDYLLRAWGITLCWGTPRKPPRLGESRYRHAIHFYPKFKWRIF